MEGHAPFAVPPAAPQGVPRQPSVGLPHARPVRPHVGKAVGEMRIAGTHGMALAACGSTAAALQRAYLPALIANSVHERIPSCAHCGFRSRARTSCAHCGFCSRAHTSLRALRIPFTSAYLPACIANSVHERILPALIADSVLERILPALIADSVHERILLCAYCEFCSRAYTFLRALRILFTSSYLPAHIANSVLERILPCALCGFRSRAHTSLRALRIPFSSAYFLRALRIPFSSAYFLRALRIPFSSAYFLRALRIPLTSAYLPTFIADSVLEPAL
jgi:hypothetical protein